MWCGTGTETAQLTVLCTHLQQHVRCTFDQAPRQPKMNSLIDKNVTEDKAGADRPRQKMSVNPDEHRATSLYIVIAWHINPLRCLVKRLFAVNASCLARGYQCSSRKHLSTTHRQLSVDAVIDCRR
jgi:hypothetical protein